LAELCFFDSVAHQHFGYNDQLLDSKFYTYNMQELPKFDETFGPILKILDNGLEIHHRALVSAVRDRFYDNLPKEILDLKTKSGDSLIENRIAWGKSYLKKGGYVHYPKRGFVQITDKGLSAVASDIDLKKVT
jgi:restriction system protein